MVSIPTHEPVTDSVTSADGTSIEFRTVGTGPGVIVVPGVLATADDYADLADALAQRFTVHTIQRRGRGGSGAQDDRYCIERERDDLHAVQAATAARFLFGHSYGGLIALQAARHTDLFDKIAVYEPGVSVNGLIRMTWVPRYRKSLANHRGLDALAVFSVATGPSNARRMPVWAMKPMLLLVLPPRRRRSMCALLDSNLREHQQVARFDNTTADYRQVHTPVLVMSGGRSRLDYASAATEALGAALPRCATHEFAKLDHFGPDRTGPRQVADVLAAYFSDQ